MSVFRLSRSAADDMLGVLEWSEEHFGAEARIRYGALILAAARHASESGGSSRFTNRPELGPDVLSWHLANSVLRSTGGKVKEPRHLMICRWDDSLLMVGRIFHEVQDPTLHFDPATDWE